MEIARRSTAPTPDMDRETLIANVAREIDAVLVRAEAAEQREREAGARLEALVGAMTGAASAVQVCIQSHAMRCLVDVCHDHAMFRQLKQAIGIIDAALAALRSGPAPDATASPDPCPICKGPHNHQTCTSCRDDGLASMERLKSAPAPVSDPPTACVRGSDGCQIKGRHSMCGTVVAEPTAKGETRRHRTWCNSRRVGGIGCTCPCVPVADPTETER